MVKNIYRILCTTLLLGSLAACTNEISDNAGTKGQRVSLTVQADKGVSTKAVYCADSSLTQWTANETIGVVAACGGSFTETDLQPFVSSNAAASSTASFSGSLIDAGEGTYRLYAISPFFLSTNVTNNKFNLPNIQYPEAGGWDPACAFMMGQSAEQVCSTGVAQATGSLSFTHKMGWLCLSFSGFGDAQNEKVQYVRITCPSTAIAGEFSANLTAQSINFSNAVDKFIIADFSDKNITLGDLNAYITMFPVTDVDIEIAVKTTSSASGHYIECSRTDLTIAAGDIVSATVTPKSNDANKTSQEDICGEMPSMTSKTDQTKQLNVLLLGHSFGEDCTQHLPGLLDSAGITNINLRRFHQNDCQLNEYWNFITTRTNPQRFSAPTAGSDWDSHSLSVNQKIEDTAWDVIILQQSTCDGRNQTSPKWGGAADYDTYQPYLSLMIEYIVQTQKTKQGKEPFIVWNMIHSSQTKWDEKYELIVSATEKMKAETGISLVLTPGTAMMKARQTNDTSTYGYNFSDANYYHILCRDLGAGGWHASQGLGRYLEACTWFEQLICPIYEAADNTLTVVGNTYLPTDKCNETGWTVSGVNYDEVTAEKAIALQNIAHATALDPFNTAQNQN